MIFAHTVDWNGKCFSPSEEQFGDKHQKSWNGVYLLMQEFQS